MATRTSIRRRAWVVGFLAAAACFGIQQFRDPRQIPLLLLSAVVWSAISSRLVIPIRRASDRLLRRTSWFVAWGLICVGIALMLVGIGAGRGGIRLPHHADPMASPAALVGVWVCQFAAAICPFREDRPGQARISRTTVPATSVRRKSRPE